MSIIDIGGQVFLFPGFVGEPSIAPGDLYVLMAHKLLEDFKAHAGVQKLRCEGVAAGVDRIPLVLQSRFPDVAHEAAPGGTVAETPLRLSVEKVYLFQGSSHEQARQGEEGVIA